MAITYPHVTKLLERNEVNETLGTVGHSEKQGWCIEERKEFSPPKRWGGGGGGWESVFLKKKEKRRRKRRKRNSNINFPNALPHILAGKTWEFLFTILANTM